MRESDTGLWLHNKLGATDELWAPPSIASLLTAAVIDNIRLCFHRLSSAVKLKLLLGTLHLPRRTVDEVRRPAALARPAPLLPALSPPGAAARTPSSSSTLPPPAPPSPRTPSSPRFPARSPPYPVQQMDRILPRTPSSRWTPSSPAGPRPPPQTLPPAPSSVEVGVAAAVRVVEATPGGGAGPLRAAGRPAEARAVAGRAWACGFAWRLSLRRSPRRILKRQGGLNSPGNVAWMSPVRSRRS